MPTHSWKSLRAHFKGSKCGQQLVCTLEALGMPEPTGWHRHGAYCFVTWNDPSGHHMQVSTNMNSWGFNEQ